MSVGGCECVLASVPCTPSGLLTEFSHDLCMMCASAAWPSCNFDAVCRSLALFLINEKL